MCVFIFSLCSLLALHALVDLSLYPEEGEEEELLLAMQISTTLSFKLSGMLSIHSLLCAPSHIQHNEGHMSEAMWSVH